VKFGGAAYLLYLAWKVFRAASASLSAQSADEVRGSLFWRGYLMNVLNPKVALFFLAFLPQFVSESAGPVWVQMMWLGLLFTAMVVCVFGVIGLFSGTLNEWMRRRSAGRFGQILNRAVSGVFVVLALRLALIER
jgi:threonine/homoserine/homoserine lactone efflux protein